MTTEKNKKVQIDAVTIWQNYDHTYTVSVYRMNRDRWGMATAENDHSYDKVSAKTLEIMLEIFWASEDWEKVKFLSAGINFSQVSYRRVIE